MRTLVLLMGCLAIGAAQTSTKKMNATPIDPDRVKLQKVATLMDEEGFYEEVSSCVDTDGNIFVLDMGNKAVHHFDQSGKHVKSFGKEGNGPGEINQFTLGIRANAKRVYLIHAARGVSVFDYDGKLVREIAGAKYPLLIRSLLTFDGDNLKFVFMKWGQFGKHTGLIFSKDGELIKEIPNPEYEDGAFQKFQGQPDKALDEFLDRPRSIHPYGNGFVQLYSKEYKIEVLDRDMRSKNMLTRSYDRVKPKDLMDLMPRSQKRIVKNLNDQQKQGFMRMMQSVLDKLGGYFPDIFNIPGSDQGYLFVRTSTDNNKEYKLDIISPNQEFVGTVTMTGDEVTSSRVENGYLLLNRTNEDDGPYVDVYKVFVK